MARPDRYSLRERGETAGEDLNTERGRTTLVSDSVLKRGERAEGETDANDEGLDGQDRSRQSSRQGQVSEGEIDLARQVARRTGWVPLDEWKRDPAKWVDADIYLDRMPGEVQRLRDRAKRTGAVADAAADAERRRKREAAEAEVRAAVQAGDEETAVAASRRVADATGPDPRTLSWVASNPWFEKDPVAKAAAMAEAKRRSDAGESVEDQLDGAEDLVRRAFPHHFQDGRRAQERDEFEEDDETHLSPPAPERREDARNGGEARLSDLRGPALAGGSRGGARPSLRSKEKGWGDIPADERAGMQRFITRFSRRGMKVEDAQRQLGIEYWKNKGTQV